MRLLHAGLRLQHGRGVLPGDRTAAHGHGPDDEHGPNGFDLHALSGNLCRCTGYRPIKDAAYALGAPPADDELAARCSQAPPAAGPVRLAADGAELVRPARPAGGAQLLAERPDAVLVAGSTDWGVEVNLRGCAPAWWSRSTGSPSCAA